MIARKIWLSMRVQFIPALLDNLSARFPIRKLLEVGLLSPSSWPDNKVERALFGDRELIRISQLCPRAQLLGVRTPSPNFCLDPSNIWTHFFLVGSVCSIYHAFSHILQCYYNSVKSHVCAGSYAADAITAIPWLSVQNSVPLFRLHHVFSAFQAIQCNKKYPF